MIEKKIEELKCGDIVKIDFSPTKGHEQKGFRPAVVLSNPETQYNIMGPLVSVAPITNRDKNYPLHVSLDDEKLKTTGVVLVDQHKLLDLNARGFKYVESLSVNEIKRCKIIMESIYEDLFKY